MSSLIWIVSDNEKVDTRENKSNEAEQRSKSDYFSICKKSKRSGGIQREEEKNEW
ncbi:uncharacterized protein METZ01_LOCUS455904, partial [marine metagenome]